MKMICVCLLAVSLLGCLADAQYYQRLPQRPPPRPPLPPRYFQPHPPIPPQQTQRNQKGLTTPPPQTPRPPPPPQTPRPPPPPQTRRPPPPPQTPRPPPPPQTPRPPPPPQSPKILPPPPFTTCEVHEQYRIQCGAPGISAAECQAINCCFDGRMCYYGYYVTVQCTKDAQFILVVSRDATLPAIDLDSIAFLGTGEKCKPVDVNSGFAIYQFSVQDCGTVAMEEPGVIIYENRMSSSYEVAIGGTGAITRDSSFQLLFQCRYVGNLVEAVVVDVGKVTSPEPIAALGPLRVELRLANGQCNVKGCVEEDVVYNSFYTDADYPVTKVLRDSVFVEVRMLERTDPNLALTLERCWANTSPQPDSLPRWDLLIDGCPYHDDNYKTQLVPVGYSSGLMYPSHHRRFIFKMFTFVSIDQGGAEDSVVVTPRQENVYIHCETAVCQITAENNCDPRCFRKRRAIAASVQKRLRTETTVVSSQQLVIIDPGLNKQ